MNYVPLLDCDLRYAVSRLPAAVRELMQRCPDLICAGGYLRSKVTGEPESDIDLFAPKPEKARIWAQSLCPVGETPYRSDFAYTVHLKSGRTVQFIHRWTYTTIEELLDSFDFTISMSAIRCFGSLWVGQCAQQYYADLAARRLVYTFPEREEAPGGSLLRVLKYTRRGYRIPLASLAGVIARIADSTGADMEKDVVANGQEDILRQKKLSSMICKRLWQVDPRSIEAQQDEPFIDEDRIDANPELDTVKSS